MDHPDSTSQVQRPQPMSEDIVYPDSTSDHQQQQPKPRQQQQPKPQPQQQPQPQPQQQPQPRQQQQPQPQQQQTQPQQQEYPVPTLSFVEVDDVLFALDKAVVATRSSILASFIGIQENLGQRVMKIPRMDSGVFREVLHYIYTDELPYPVCYGMLDAAELFGLQDLKCWCEHHLIRTIAPHTLPELLVLAIDCRAQLLLRTCLSSLYHNMHRVLETESWRNLWTDDPRMGQKILQYLANWMRDSN